MRVYLLILSVFFSTALMGSDYQFVGRHLILSYLDCDQEALLDEERLKEVMHEAAKASKVTILSSSHHHFSPSGMTQVLLLSESHSSIHTYPEFRSCFVDLFTCGLSFDMQKFEEVLSSYLKPSQTIAKFLLRNDDHQEIAFVPYKNGL